MGHNDNWEAGKIHLGYPPTLSEPCGLLPAGPLLSGLVSASIYSLIPANASARGEMGQGESAGKLSSTLNYLLSQRVQCRLD